MYSYDPASTRFCTKIDLTSCHGQIFLFILTHTDGKAI